MTRSERPFADWIGRESEAEDVLTARLVASFHAVLEAHLAPIAADEAPLGIHWCLAPAVAAMSELGPDGHPAKNRDLPPVPLPRRMWAGGSLEFLDRLRVGDRVRRVSKIADVTHKHGRSGELWFVAVDHEYATERGAALRERQDIVYRPAAAGPRGGAVEAPALAEGHARGGAVRAEFATSSSLLFRYSALTFNGHRIHYDLPYATNVEGYGGLVVHGPLQATLLLNRAAADHGVAMRGFSYRARAPAIAGKPFLVCADAREKAEGYWTMDPPGRILMEAAVKVA
jgi:3-methylfumaryl-CoA hydratase